MSQIESHASYIFVFAHPDDEVYCCVLMNRLLAAGKAVSAVFVTSGDAGMNAGSREAEIAESMSAIGLPAEATFKLRVSESEMLGSFQGIIASLNGLVAQLQPECIVGMDYEGGHEGHDSASFIASEAAAKAQLTHYVFPAYHAEAGQRQGAVFIPGRPETDTVVMSDGEVGTKIKVLEAHRGQLGHFLHLQRMNPDYFKLLFAREVFRLLDERFDYTTPPTAEIGYESHRNGSKFADFSAAIERYHNAT